MAGFEFVCDFNENKLLKIKKNLKQMGYHPSRAHLLGLSRFTEKEESGYGYFSMPGLSIRR